MASNDPPPSSQSPGPGPGTHPSASNYLPDLPLVEDLQPLLGSGYVVESFLGQGGMGAVYKGLQMPLRRPVAIKILQKRQAAGGEDDFAFEERFKREAYAMAALTHPHIVQVYDCGDAGPNFLFISMELVEGGDLSDALKAGQVTPEIALKLIPQICDGLRAAHERGIVHRDIKPANIFLTRDGRAKVADFGLAKKFDAKNTLVTKAGLGMGTPDYAAPEQFDGVEDLDHRADIYSLGVMMYQMLTGRLPRGATFKMPSQLVGVDPRIDAIISKAMESEREDRYQSTAQIKADLAQITATLSPSSPAPLNTGAIPVIDRPVTGPRPVTVTRPVTTTRPVSQPSRRPASGIMKAVPVATADTGPDQKKPKLVLIGSIVAGVVAIGFIGLFLLKKPSAPAAAARESKTPAISASSTLSGSEASKNVGLENQAKPSVDSSLAAFVPGQWTKIPTQKIRLSAGASVQNESIVMTAPDLYASPVTPLLKNVAMQVKVRRSDDIPRGLRLIVRIVGNTANAFGAVSSTGGPQGVIQTMPGSAVGSPQRKPAPCEWLTPGKESTFMFLAVDDLFSLVVDGRIVLMHRDARHDKAGNIQINSGRGNVELRDLQVMALDGLSPDKYPDSVKAIVDKVRATPAGSGAVNPATHTIAAAPPPAGEFPPGQWVKPFHKFEDLPEVHRKSGTLKWEDSWLKPTDAAKGFGFSIPGLKGSNMAIRIVMRNPAANPSGGPVLQTRITSNDGRYELIPSGGSLAISHLKEPNRTSLANGTRRLLITPDRDISIEMAVIGTRLYGRGDGGLAVSATDSRVASGGIGIHSKSWIRDIEVMNLDGVPEAEALRFIGVDEKGNDVRLAESEKFAPGVWTKLYTQPDQLPPDVRLPTSGVTWDDGWIHYEKGTRLYLPSSLVGNYGVRARFQRLSTKSTATITLRNQSLSAVEQYRLYNSGGNQFACGVTKGSDTVTFFNSPVPTPVASGSEYTMEFGAVGSLLVGRLNDSLVKKASDDRYKTGHAYFTGSESTRDIEVINLNGLSEAEALRLLGVDEAGNDVRPQELQRMEQARLTNAIATIPELKQLHDQFLALLSDRVTAPYQTELTKLNNGYVGGLDRALSDEKAAGRTDSAQALEAEKKLIASSGAMPATDDATVPDVLKKLRGIYRSSRAQIEAQRASGVKALVAPLSTRLAALAADFTARGRANDAKTAQEYIESLNASDADAAPAVPALVEGAAATTKSPATTTSAPADQSPARTFPPADPEKAGAWVLSVGGWMEIEERGAKRMIRSSSDLPKTRFDILRVWIDKNKSANTPTVVFTTLEPLAGLKTLTFIETHSLDVTDADTDVLASLPALTACSIYDAKKFTGQRLSLFRRLDRLQSVTFASSGITRAGLEAIASLKPLTKIDLSGVSTLTDDDLGVLGEMKSLRTLLLRTSALTGKALRSLNKLDGLTEFGWNFRPGSALEDARLIADLFPRVKSLVMELGAGPSGSEVSAVLGCFPALDRTSVGGGGKLTDDIGLAIAGAASLKGIYITANSSFTNTTFEALAAHKNLESLHVDETPSLTRSSVTALVKSKTLKRLDIEGNSQIGDDVVAEFKKQRPDVTVVK